MDSLSLAVLLVTVVRRVRDIFRFVDRVQPVKVKSAKREKGKDTSSFPHRAVLSTCSLHWPLFVKLARKFTMMTKRPAEKKLGMNQRELSLSFGNHYGQDNANELYNMIFIRFIWRCVGFPRLCLVVTPWCFYRVFLCESLLAYLSSYCISLFFPPNMDCQVGMERAITGLWKKRGRVHFEQSGHAPYLQHYRASKAVFLCYACWQIRILHSSSGRIYRIWESLWRSHRVGLYRTECIE